MASIDFTNGVTLSDAGWADDVDVSAYSVLTSVSGTNTIVATGAATYSYAATRTPIWFIPANTNTAATTINVTPSGGSALGAKNIFRNGVALVGGEIKKNVPTAVIYDGTQFQLLGNGADASPLDIPGLIHGLTLSNNVADATNDIDIAAGTAIDSTGVRVMRGSAIIKRLDAAWAVGTNQGGLDTGAIANTTYHVFLIARSDTGVVDALFSASATAPTMPANYDYKRRIGSILRESAAIVAFVQDGDLFQRSTPILDADVNTPTTNAVTRTLSVPTGVNVVALLNVAAVGDSAGAVSTVYISDLATTDVAASSTAAPLGSVGNVTSSAESAIAQVRVRTNTSAQIRTRNLASTVGVLLRIATLGWIDTRGRNA